jgi:hypothetical protein
MMAKGKRAALYVRVSTDRQTVQNQFSRLTEVATARGWTIVETYNDAGISGAKRRKDRPGLDQMLKDAQRHRFDVVMAWSIDRIGRSLSDLLDTIRHLERTWQSAPEKRVGTTFARSFEIAIRFRRPVGRWAAVQRRRRAPQGLQQGVARSEA